MTDGEWWRRSGPWSGRSGGGAGASGGSAGSGAAGDGSGGGSGASGASDGDSVYDAPSPGGGTPSVPLDPPRPPRTPASGAPPVPLDKPRFDGPEDDPGSIPPPQVYSSGANGWDLVLLNFSDAPQAPPRPIPEQRAGGEAGSGAEGAQTADPAGAGAGSAASAKGRKQRKARARAATAGKAKAQPAAPAGAGAGASAGAGAGAGAGARRPSLLVLLSCGLLVGGAAMSFFPAMLVGWGLGYLSRQLSDLMRKFAILGVPLITMSAATLHAMQAKAGAQGGAGVQAGSQFSQISWSAAPGVLRLSAVLSAVVLLLLSLRRRPPQQG
ncbi:hypothetical protein ACIPLC_20625 [Kitasatospora sp. NPDC086801]|uniref:hypothetical protein n=1 Tax=Kitasatospora sp. NPDC086801 TaxID=3364066 RepID=UPI00381E3F2E